MVSNLPQREEYFRRKRKKRLIRVGLVTLLIIFIIGLASYVSHRQKIRISKVELVGGVLVTQPEIEKESLEFMNGSYFWLFPKDNALWYPRKGLENYLPQSFKRIDNIKIERKGWNIIVVEINERKPVATWCSNAVSESNMSECYFVDGDGTLFATAPYFSGDAYFKYYGVIATGTPIGTQYIASTTKFNEIVNFVESVRGLSLRPQYIIAKSSEEFSLILSGGGQIYFDTKISLLTVLENLEALLRTPELSIKANYDLPVEYIDMRFGNKLFYKLKQ